VPRLSDLLDLVYDYADSIAFAEPEPAYAGRRAGTRCSAS
jgi:hypothetical protein